MSKIDLSPHFEEYIREAVESGRYASESDVIRDALRLHEERETARSAAAAILRSEAEVGLADLAAGRVHAVPDFGRFRELTEPEV